MSCDLWKSVRRLGVSITELRGLGDCGDGNEALRLFERLRLENVEKVVRLRLMLRETELKIAEKSRRPVITELRYNAESSDWTDVLSCFCQKAATEDRRFATQLHMLREEMANVCEKRRNFVIELSSMRRIIVTGKATEFVFDIVGKDEAEMAQLHELERQMELRALEKELFIQKLVRNMPDVVSRNQMNAHGGCCMLTCELARAANSNDIRDQLSVLFMREVNDQFEKMHDYCILSDELREDVRKRDAYIEDLQMFQMFDSSDEVRKSVEMMKGMQVDDMQKTSRLLLMAEEVQNKVYEKNFLIIKASVEIFLQKLALVLLLLQRLNYLFLLAAVQRDSGEVSKDVARVKEYTGVACGLKIAMRRREECIRELKTLGVVKTVRFMEGMQQDDMEKCDRSLLLMKEMEVKAREKSRMEPQFILRCRKEIAEDVRLAREINALCARVIAIVDERESFVNELDILMGRSVSGKMAEFMKQIQGKDIPNLMKLQILEQEFELRAREKDIFIEKLRGNIDF
nr:hypothetical protein [Tanacetum cinerariifolium]